MELMKIKRNIVRGFIVTFGGVIFLSFVALSVYSFVMGILDLINYIFTEGAEKVIFNRGHYIGFGGMLVIIPIVLIGFNKITNESSESRYSWDEIERRYLKIMIVGALLLVLLPIVAELYYKYRFSNSSNYIYCKEESNYNFRAKIIVYVKDISLCRPSR